jgi:hypothetical protein
VETEAVPEKVDGFFDLLPNRLQWGIDTFTRHKSFSDHHIDFLQGLFGKEYGCHHG